MQEKIIQEFFQRFQQEVLIVELMGRLDRVPQTNNGVQQSYNCLFHSDSTPSFYVNLERNVFRCFGCERDGGPYRLIKEYLLFENQSATPQSIVTFAGVDFKFPNFQRYEKAEPGKRGKFKSMLTATSSAAATENKAAIITRIMMGFSDTASDVNLWEEFLS